MAKSSIEWTDETWNPVAGCTRASRGCDNCYAVRMSHRLQNMGQSKYSGLTVVNGRGDRHFNGTVRCVEEDLTIPLRWKKPRRCFVNSMSDLFHRDVPFDFIDRVFAVMALCPQHTFQILTKRPERMAEYFAGDRSIRLASAIVQVFDKDGRASVAARAKAGQLHPLPNVWLGTSCEDQAAADERIPHLLRCPAAVRFLSCEPLIGPIDLLATNDCLCQCDGCTSMAQQHPDQPGLQRIHWVIAGGESGPGARPMHPDWARSLRDQCQAAGVPFFFKQWGEWCPGEAWDGWKEGARYDEARWFDEKWLIDRRVPARIDRHREDAADVYRIGKQRAGRNLDGRTWDEYPEVAHV